MFLSAIPLFGSSPVTFNTLSSQLRMTLCCGSASVDNHPASNASVKYWRRITSLTKSNTLSVTIGCESCGSLVFPVFQSWAQHPIRKTVRGTQEGRDMVVAKAGGQFENHSLVIYTKRSISLETTMGICISLFTHWYKGNVMYSFNCHLRLVVPISIRQLKSDAAWFFFKFTYITTT